MPTLCLVEVTQLRTKAVDGRLALFTKIYIKKWKTPHFVLSRRRASRDFHEILHGDRGRPCHHFRSYTFLGPIHSFDARGRRKFDWKRPNRSKLLIILSFVEIKQPYLAKLCRLRTRVKLVNFIKIVQGTRPLGAIILVKFQFFSVLRAVNPHRWIDQGQIWQGAPPCQIWPWSVQRVAPAGRKTPKIGPWVNEIPAELPFGQILLVINTYAESHTASKPGAAGYKAAQNKVDKYKRLTNTHIFYPVATETVTWRGHRADTQDWQANHHHHRRHQGNDVFVPTSVHGSQRGNVVSFHQTWPWVHFL